jgi:predicted nuclease with TOPRIM domain
VLHFNYKLMNCSTSVFILSSGAAALAFSAMYFYVQNIAGDLKKKLKSYNTALSQLQQERTNLIIKTEDMFSNNASQSTLVAHLQQENTLLRGAIERLETDNHLLIGEYKKLEEMLFDPQPQRRV